MIFGRKIRSCHVPMIYFLVDHRYVTGCYLNMYSKLSRCDVMPGSKSWPYSQTAGLVPHTQSRLQGRGEYHPFLYLFVYHVLPLVGQGRPIHHCSIGHGVSKQVAHARTSLHVVGGPSHMVAGGVVALAAHGWLAGAGVIKQDGFCRRSCPSSGFGCEEDKPGLIKLNHQ